MSIALQPRWLVALDLTLRKLKLPVHELVCSSGRLHISFRQGEHDSLVATVSPRGDGGQGWAETGRYILGYEGARDLDLQGRRWMSGLLRVIERYESHLPPTFPRPCARFSDDTPPQERFRRLFSFCTVEHSQAGETRTTEVLIRTTDRCNLACPFCSGPPLIFAPDQDLISICLQEAAQAYPGAILSLTGGEPTLRQTFFAEVEQALGLPGDSPVQVQTNAVAFASRLDPADLPPRGRLSFFVSLHALNGEIFDRCTGSRGQMELAVAGIDRLIQAGHPVVINCVVTSANIDHLPDYVPALAGRFGSEAPLELHFSTLICPEYRPSAGDFLVSYSRVAAALQRAAEAGRRSGLRISPLRSSTHASIPACLLGEGSGKAGARRPLLHPRETGYEDFSRLWVKAERCRQCVETETCLGVPRTYAQRLGLDELSPLAAR